MRFTTVINGVVGTLAVAGVAALAIDRYIPKKEVPPMPVTLPVAPTAPTISAREKANQEIKLDVVRSRLLPLDAVAEPCCGDGEIVRELQLEWNKRADMASDELQRLGSFGFCTITKRDYEQRYIVIACHRSTYGNDPATYLTYNVD